MNNLHVYHILHIICIIHEHTGCSMTHTCYNIFHVSKFIPNISAGTISFTVMLCVVSLVVLLAIVFGITCMLVRRRRQTMKALTESQFSFK